MHLITYLDLLQTTERTLASSFQLVSAGHAADADVHWATARFGRQCTEHAEVLAQTRARSAEPSEPAPERLHAQGLSAVRSGPVGLLRDLQDLHQLTTLVDITWELIGQAAHAVRDRGLIHTVEHYAPETRAQLAWLRMQMKSAAPQTLVVAQ
ncbi:hypothetical protein PV394_02160 [Streptomyces sp. NE06-03E]|uniref:DUF892 family protein n=1 Tax=Streptomyces sp. gb1(2016) TaxID=1828321 RepID=A0A652L5L5_9ACTN|nr:MULTISPECIES: hypothetical protein [unclassified Streptomyces]MDX3053952.1 hypothetical protein [Streptomyces sp. NE06-03E]TXS31200.1 hypothetical protein EAO74_10000 [Streptomyces sp. gb1(2016)]